MRGKVTDSCSGGSSLSAAQHIELGRVQVNNHGGVGCTRMSTLLILRIRLLSSLFASQSTEGSSRFIDVWRATGLCAYSCSSETGGLFDMPLWRALGWAGTPSQTKPCREIDVSGGSVPADLYPAQEKLKGWEGADFTIPVAEEQRILRARQVALRHPLPVESRWIHDGNSAQRAPLPEFQNRRRRLRLRLQ